MDRAQRRHHGRFDRQRMRFDMIGTAERLDAFVLAAKIYRALHAELAQHGRVGRREVAEMVRAEQLAPSPKAAVLADIAAEIAKIAGAGEIEMAGRGF